jgi:hypothetical protein
MQLTIDVDKHFIENLQKEFHTTNIKDALSQLFDFYQKNNLTKLDTEIESRVADYKNGILETKDFHDGLDTLRQTILSKI